MDVGPIRSIGPPSGRTEPRKPTTPSPLAPAQTASRASADGAASTGDAANEQEKSLPAPGRLRRERAAPREAGTGRTAENETGQQAPPNPFDDMPEGLKQVMEVLAEPIRTLLAGDELSTDAKKALAQALTQADVDAPQDTAQPLAGTEGGAAERRYEELEAAIDAFHDALKRIFRIGADAAASAASDPDRRLRDRRLQAEGKAEGPRETSPLSAGPSRRVGELARIQAIYKPASEEMEATAASLLPGDAADGPDRMYARFASMYTARYGASSERAPLLNAEG